MLTLWRGAEQIQVSVEPVEAAEHKGYRLGLWVKDDMAGIGTLTYFDQDGNFGALGHGIGNGQTKDLLRLSDGRLYKAQVLGIKKGVREHRESWRELSIMGKTTRSEKCPAIHKSVSMAR